MILFQFNSDVLFLSTPDHVKEIPYQNIERVIPDELFQLVEHEVNTKKSDNVHLVAFNWPGSFTCLRVWSLSCTTLAQTYKKKPVILWNIPKMTLFAHLVDAWKLPKTWVVFMGQRKKMWLCRRNVEQQEWEVVWRDIEHIWVDWFESNSLSDEYFVDFVQHHPVLSHVSLEYQISPLSFWDVLDSESDISSLLLSLTYQGEKISFTLDDVWILPVNRILPTYCMAPNIG